MTAATTAPIPDTAITEAGSQRAEREQMGKWCIWTKTGRRPSFFHDSLESAEREAERLATLTPGKKFIVMQVVSKFGLPPATPADPEIAIARAHAQSLAA